MSYSRKHPGRHGVRPAVIAAIYAVILLAQVPHAVRARAQAAPPSSAAIPISPAYYAESARESGESLYRGTIEAPMTQNGALILQIDYRVSPDGKKESLSPPRRKIVHVPADIVIRSADPAQLVLSPADLVPGSTVFVLGVSSGGRTDEITVRGLLAPVEGSEVVPGSLLKPWSTPANWTFRANANAAPNSAFSQENGSLKIKVGGQPIREWHAQIFQQASIGANQLVPNQRYTLRFQARASTRHFLTIGSERDVTAPYRNMGLLETVLLTPRWQVFQCTFTTPPDATGPIRLPVFSAAHRGGDVYLANIALVAGDLPLPPSLQAEQKRQVAPNVNLITDANDADAWLIYSENAARGSVAQAIEPGGGKVLQVTVQSASAQPYHLQLLRPALPLVEGREYLLEFLARADKKRPLDVEGQATIGDFHNIGLSKVVDLDTSWKPYSIRFTARRVVPGHSHAPQFCFAQAEGVVWLSNVSLKMLP